MAYTRFHLENPRGEDLAYIRCTVKLLHGDYYRFYTGEKVRPRDWARQRVKRSCTDYASINHYLDMLASKINNERRLMLMDGRLTKIEMRHYVDGLFGKNRHDFYSVWDEIINEKKLRSSGSSKNMLHEKYQNIKNKLYEYDADLSWRDIRTDMLYRWISHLYEEYDLSSNTVHRYIKFLKTFMNETKKRGYHDEEEYRDFKVGQRDVLNPYLTIDELNVLHHMKVADEYMDHVRINLLKGCYSGQRHSDWHKLVPENMVYINGEHYYQLIQTKTKKLVLIPAHERLRDMVERPHRHIDNQQFNLAVKDLCEAAGISSIFIKPSYKGDKVTQNTYKKHQLASSHIARRSFVCNSLLAGVPASHIMKVGGWTSYSSMKGYIQLSSTDGLEQFEGVWDVFNEK